jgi:hypothetical protein
MSTVPSPNLPHSSLSTRERRRNAPRWKWNGNRHGDPHLPRVDTTLAANPGRVLFYALAGSLIGLGIFFFALR